MGREWELGEGFSLMYFGLVIPLSLISNFIL
jgi:hypothetical protein